MEPTESQDSAGVLRLYEAVLDAWNRRDAAAFASLFAERGGMVGFDGSQVNGAAAISAHLAPIFADHPTPAYIGVVEETRTLAPDVVLLRAVSGLVPAGQDDIVPALNAIQTLVAGKYSESWRIEMFQNTPAQFHGREDLADALTAKLREALSASRATG